MVTLILWTNRLIMVMATYVLVTQGLEVLLERLSESNINSSLLVAIEVSFSWIKKHEAAHRLEEV